MIYVILTGAFSSCVQSANPSDDTDGQAYMMPAKAEKGRKEKIMNNFTNEIFSEIETIAIKYYNPIGQNSWQHIQLVLTQAIKFVRYIEKRDISPIEYAAVLFHDSSVKSDPSKDHHALKGAEIAKTNLDYLFDYHELDDIYISILEHDKQDNPSWIFTTNTSDILASADANPPDVDWILNKAWAWGLKQGLAKEDRIRNILSFIPKVYGATPEEGGVVWPWQYAVYYKNKIEQMRIILKSLTAKTCEDRIIAYRKLHNLSETDIRLTEPCL